MTTEKPKEAGAEQAAIALQEAILKLRDREAQLAAILESTADGILAVDNHGKVVMFNHRFAELWQLPEEAASSMDDKVLLDFVVNQVREPEHFLKTVMALYQSDRSTVDQVLFKDGRIFERHSSPTRRDGAVSGRVWSFSDITDRKKAEQRQEQLSDELARKNRELENVLYAASHDLRSPLLNLQGFSQRLEQTSADLNAMIFQAESLQQLRQAAAPILQDRIPKSMQFIKSGVSKMDLLIGGLLRLSRLGHAAMRREILDMNLVIKRILAAMEFQIQSAEATVEIEAVPSCEGDNFLIEQAFSNLVDNAVKYRDPSRPLNVRISGRIQGGEVCYCVSDTGIGMAAGEIDKIWELFRRLQPKGPVTGEGLGLNLVRRIIERHQGRVWAESEPGQGSKFWVALPQSKRTITQPAA